MKNLGMFRQFVKATEKNINTNKDVWIYTRVSSKDQESNKSLTHQLAEGHKLAKENNYIVTSTFGGTYESASGDMTRVEFMKLINAVRSANKKPFAILLNTISRFSRTGGNGIALANELVEKLGVNLIEVSTGKNTITEDGKLEIYAGLLKARQENLDRLKVTIPGLKKFLEEGNWLGRVPKGYDHYGPRVKSVKFFNPVQKVEINAEGEILKHAWQWKLQGEKDFMIIQKLSNLGLKVTKQSISSMWRNPFYCGVLCNSLSEGEVYKGNWPKMISENDFLFIQKQIKEGNRQSYRLDKANVDRPLNAFIFCSECNSKMCGYEVKKKRLHYYKCNNCKGVSINAKTSIKAKNTGAHELFEIELSKYQLHADLKDLFKEQLKLTYEQLTNESNSETELAEKQYDKCVEELKLLKKRYATDSSIDKEIYLELKAELEMKINEISAQMKNDSSKISNLQNYLNISESVVSNISKYWASGDLETKKRIQQLVFKDGIVLDTKKRQYLTKKVNSIFSLSNGLNSIVMRDTKKKRHSAVSLFNSQKQENLCLVAGARLERTTFGL